MEAVVSAAGIGGEGMAKLLLITGFVLALSTLGFAAANANVPTPPGQMLAVDYD